MRPFGGIEAGGSKFVCGVGSGPHDLRTAKIPTTSPQETMHRVLEFFMEAGQSLEGIGIASFGPIDLVAGSPTYGYITSTPKPGWNDFDIAGKVKRALRIPVAFDTDVNGAVLAETRWGAARGLSDAMYLTVGTGIGGGAIVGGQLVHGMLHPEMGHIRVPHNWTVDPYKGSCPYHGDCLEGLASGRAMEERWGVKSDLLEVGHPGWDLEAEYLALGLSNWVFTLSPQKIIIGGGVPRHPTLLNRIRTKLAAQLNGYVRAPQVLGPLDDYVVAPALGDRAGVLGAIALAQR